MFERALVHQLGARTKSNQSLETKYNEERRKRALGGLTPSRYAKQLAKKTVTVTGGL